MIHLSLEIPGHSGTVLPLPDGVYRVGSGTQANIQLPCVGISQQHCVLTVRGTTLTVQDSNSSNGTTLDGVNIGTALREVMPGSVIGLANVRMIRDAAKNTSGASDQTTVAAASLTPDSCPLPASVPAPAPAAQDGADTPVLQISGIPAKARPFVQELKKGAHQELLKRLNLKRMALNNEEGAEKALAEKAVQTIHEIISELNLKMPPGVTREKIENELFHEAIGLGPLEDLIAMSEITEIMVNGPDKVYVEYKGKLYKTDTAFADNSQVIAAIERIVSPLGRRIDESSPMVDARLKDGSRVNAIIPPLSLVGPSITIRKFSKNPLQVSDLIRFGSISQPIADFLDMCVKVRKNIIISGGTGSGKTTLLNILSSFLPNRERIVTIEDAAELQLRQDHVVRLESRPANVEGKGEINIRDLVRNSLRMRPDRIVIGECRGGEALDMLQAMNTGHDGSLTTIHANSPRDALARLETLVLMAGFDLPLRAIREQVASAISIIVQISRERDGTRKVNCVSEITKMEGDIITMQDIFVYKQDGWTADGKMTGRFVPTGNVPTFLEDITRAGIHVDMSLFTPPKEKAGGSF